MLTQEEMKATELRAKAYLNEVSLKVEKYLDQHLPPQNERPEKLHECMRYSMFAGGKRLRPALAYAAFTALGGKDESIYFATSALEMLHTFSLIHDDLPCMDDDDYRRGRKTAHKVYGEAIAVLAGDALCIHAFELLSRTGNALAIGALAQSLGSYGMIGGQVVDIESEGKKVGLETVDYIHYHKTAALIQSSLVVGAHLAGASKEVVAEMSNYGKRIGLAFQIMDDILDIEQTTEQLGKDAGSDIARGKATYPSLLGVDESRARAWELYNQAMDCLKQIPCETSILADLAAFIITRVN
jgi:geranylgeranyl diphosphate synthase, type II